MRQIYLKNKCLRRNRTEQSLLKFYRQNAFLLYFFSLASPGRLSALVFLPPLPKPHFWHRNFTQISAPSTNPAYLQPTHPIYQSTNRNLPIQPNGHPRQDKSPPSNFIALHRFFVKSRVVIPFRGLRSPPEP